jgi:hypothetical protein
MQLRFRSILLVLAAGFVVAACSFSSWAQQAGTGAYATTPAAVAPAAIPDAPAPQIELAADVDPQSGQAQNTQQPAINSDPPPASPSPALKNGATQSSSSSQAQLPGTAKSLHGTAADQIREQEHQRVGGVVPAFNISYRWDAVSLTAGQKLGLAFRSASDPVTFAAGFVGAGYHEALDNDTGFGWGAEGYFKRSGAAYLDAFDSNMIGNGLLPALLHQDPRYFRMGPAHGTVMHRMLYSLATNVVCKHDNTGRWEPKSKIGGNIIAGAISNLYYPSQSASWSQTIDNGMIVTAEGTIGSLFQEFWPDISRKFLHRDPTHGLDAQVASTSSGPTQK